jgi:hypothetical protein
MSWRDTRTENLRKDTLGITIRTSSEEELNFRVNDMAKRGWVEVSRRHVVRELRHDYLYDSWWAKMRRSSQQLGGKDNEQTSIGEAD